MACAHSFGEWCAECIAGVVADYNVCRTRLAHLEAERDALKAELDGFLRGRITKSVLLERAEAAEQIVKLAQEWKRAEQMLDNTASDGPLKQASADAQRAVLALFAALPPE